MTTPLAAKIAREYGTPVAVIDMDRVERNIARIQAACDAAGVANRPHIKTHKSPMLARMQVAAGAKGITCQKLGEAEVMVDGGLDDILISYNILGEQKVGRLGRLLHRPGTGGEPDGDKQGAAGRDRGSDKARAGEAMHEGCVGGVDKPLRGAG